MELPSPLRGLCNSLLDFVYPPLCQVCGNNFEAVDENIWLCPQCRKSLTILEYPYCPICRTPQQLPVQTCPGCKRSAPIRWVYSLGTYEPHLAHLIKAFKYTPKPNLGTMLGKMLGEKLRSLPAITDYDAICSVPIHPAKESQRGFDQAAIIATAAAAVVAIDYFPNQLVQTRKARDQIGLALVQRYRNVKSIFAVTEDFELVGRNVIIIDDVTTSGATLNAAAITLAEAGCRKLAAATVAVAIEDNLLPEALYQLVWEGF